ncbi:MAG TPA: hypothetical protein ACFE0H_09155 [Elainellaceae cyanobacterium]
MPNLFQATQDYWQKLDALEAAYQRGDVSIEDVDGRVKELMKELGQERRAALRFFWSNLSRFWREQKETITATALVGMLTYAWIVIS